MVLVADQTREDINFGNNETTKDCVAKVKKKKKIRGNPAFLLRASSSAPNHNIHKFILDII